MEIPEPIRALVEAWMEAHDAHDAERLAALYAEDGMVMLPDGSRATGRGAIAACYRAQWAGKVRDQPRAGPRKFYFFPPLVHATATATGRHGEKHSVLDILVRQADGSYLFACSSWTYR